MRVPRVGSSGLRSALAALVLMFGALQPAAIAPVLADPASPLSVTKTATPNPVASGDQLTYTISVKNTGGAKLDNVVMTDQVNGVGVIQNPPALPQLIITSSKGSCTQGGPNGNVVTCAAGSLAGQESWTVTIRGQVTAADGTTLNNTASVSATKAAQNFTTNASVSTLVSGGSGGSLADLTINKTGPTSVAAGDPITYTLTVNNIGTANATGVRVVDTLPSGVTFVSTSTTSLFVCTAAGSPVTVTCDGGAVNQGKNATITINATAPSPAPSPNTITNTAVVDPDNSIVESNELNNTSATVNTTIGGPPPPSLLSIFKTDNNPTSYPWSAGAGPDPVNPGQLLTYKIQVTNNATSRADDVVVTDGTQGLDASSIVVSQVVANGTVGNNGGCVVVAPRVRCSIRTLNPGGTQTITITGLVFSSAGSTIFNTATVTGNIKNTGVTSTASEATTVRAAVDLTITKADRPDPVCARSWPTDGSHLSTPPDGLTSAAGSPTALLADPVCLGGLTYDFVVGNSGNSDAAGVTVRDPLPAGLIFDSYSTDGGFVCAVDASNVVICTGGSVPAASIRHISFLLVAPPTAGTITNTVTVDPNNAIFEADETNNTATQSTNVATGVDLVVWKSDSNPADPPGVGAPTLTPGTTTNLGDGYDAIATRGTETYTIYADNVGTQDVTGIRLRDTLPADTVFLSVVADASHGFTCAHDGSSTGGVVECVGGHILGSESEFYDPAGPPPPGPGDDFATIKIRVFARSSVGTMHNEVRIDPLNEIAETNELNNLATDDTTVTTGNADKGAYHQLTVTKTQVDPSTGAGDPNETVATNGTLIYNLHVENLGTDPVSNVVVRDYLPAGTRFRASADTAAGPAAFFCTHDGAATGGTITCTGGDLSGSINTITGVPTSRDIRVTLFAPNAPGSITNLATVDPDNIVAEGNEFDNDSSYATTVTVGGNNMFNELNLTKTQSSPTTTCGSPPVPCVATSSVVEYTLVVKNDGSDPAFQVKVRDTLPAGFTFISADDSVSGSSAFQCTSAANVVDCTSARIDGLGATRTIVVQAFSATQPGDYVNQAVVDPDNAIPEGNETNNTAQATTRVRVGSGYADLKVTKSGPATVLPGATITYQLQVENIGSDPAFNVKLRDDLPDHTTFVSAVDTTATSLGAFSCSLVGSSIVCTGATLDGTADMIPAPDDVPTTRTIEIKVLAPASISAFVSDQSNISLDLYNRAVVDPDNTVPESNETNNTSASVKTTVSPAINLTLDKQGPGSASQNEMTTYTITVTNNKIGGGAIAQGVTIVDPLPVGLIPLNVEADPGNFTCALTENPVNGVTCVGDLNPGDTVTITIAAFVTLESGTLDNEACVDPDNTIAETNELDNCKHAISSVTPPAPDLQINKTADKGSVTSGETLTYTLNVSNVGTGDTTFGNDIVVTDNVPSEVTVQEVTPDGGWDCSATTGNSVSCTRPSMTAGDSSNIVIRTTAGATLTAPFANTASVSGGGDTQSNNNEASVTTSVGPAAIDLTVVSVTDNPDPVNRSHQLTYTSVVTNAGTSGATGAIVRVELPDMGVSSGAVAATNGFNCAANATVDPSGNTFDCTGDFGAGGSPTDSTTITATMTVTPSAPNDLTLTVTADPDGAIAESNETNNGKSETTTVSGTVCTSTPCVDLVAADIFDNPDPVKASDGSITYTGSIVNVGDSPVDPTAIWSIDITYTGPGSPALSGFPDLTQCAAISDPDPLVHHVRCTSKASGTDWMDLSAGGGLTFTVTVTGASTPGTATLKLELDQTAPAITEFDEGNNVLIETTTIVS